MPIPTSITTFQIIISGARQPVDINYGLLIRSGILFKVHGTKHVFIDQLIYQHFPHLFGRGFSFLFCLDMMLLSVYEGRRKGGNWGMGSHIDRINIFLLFIGAAFFMPAVDGHRYGDTYLLELIFSVSLNFSVFL